MLMVSTFYEWHEDTAIEPTIVAAATKSDDSGSNAYTQGYSYRAEKVSGTFFFDGTCAIC